MQHIRLRQLLRPGWIAVVAVAAAVGTAVAAGDHDSKGHAAAGPGKAPEAAGHVAPEEVQTPAPPFSEGIFPCSDCHKDMTVNPVRRELTDEHTNIVFEHDAKNRWCLDCHNPGDRDKLRLASGALIDFSQSYLLCGQCHGPTYRDWKAGVHGKRTGQWNGKKQYFLCAHCHNPHSPRIKPIVPFPAPRQPKGDPVIPAGRDR